MAIKHHTIPPAGTPNAIDQPQWAEGHDVDSAGITFNDTTVQVTAAVPYTAGTNVTITVASGTSSIAAPIAAGSNVTLTSASGTLTIAAAGGVGVTAGTNITIATSGGTATIAAPMAAGAGIALTSASGTSTIALAANFPFTAGFGISITAASGTSSIAVNQAANFVWSGTQTFTGAEAVSTSTMTFDGASALSIAGNLTVGGTATLSGQVRMTGTETISGPLFVGATATFTNTVALSAMVVHGTSTLYAWGTGTNWPVVQMAGMAGLLGYGPTGQIICLGGGMYYNGTSYIYGQAGTGVTWAMGSGTFMVNIANTTGTAGQSVSLAGLFQIANPGIYCYGTLSCTNTVVLSGPLSATGNAFFFGTCTFTNSISFTGPCFASGTWSHSNQLTVTGTASFQSQVTINSINCVPSIGTFTATYNLGTGKTVTAQGIYNISAGGLVAVTLGTGLGTATGTTMTITGLPAVLSPNRAQVVQAPVGAHVNANSYNVNGCWVIPTNGTWTFGQAGIFTITNSSQCGIGTNAGGNPTMTYSLL